VKPYLVIVLIRWMRPADCPGSDDVEWPHHFVVFMLENVTVPNVASGKVSKARDDTCDFSWWTSDDVFPCCFARFSADCRSGELDGANPALGRFFRGNLSCGF